MLVPFRKETLTQPRFLSEEVRFDIVNSICAGECAVALQTEDGGAFALGNLGRNVWLWVDEERGSAYASAAIEELAETLKDAQLPGAVATPENARLFCQAYCRASGATSTFIFELMAYACRAVITPVGVPGRMEKAGEEHAETVADFVRGFNLDCFGTQDSPEQALEAAKVMIAAGKPYLWFVDGKAVCLAGIVRRSARHARIAYVYTPPEERCKGYAAALVAQVSLMAMGEGLMPILYADTANPASNKAYRNIGYVPEGQVSEYAFHY